VRTVSNPFDDDNGIFSVLVNEEGQHCLWPEAIPVPSGWRATLTGAPRQSALEYVETVWSDLRPSTLRLASATDLSR
jgi:MbtH protein